ncbi:MAG TPA: peptidoglycan-binding protein, partial [Xanthobacteraceae bacterium]|nr:peptidoglycan-binding protein [Xanthobacteraceae bacterium]
MNKIALPLKFGTRSAAVADLQDALQHLLAAQTGRLDEAERNALEDLLRERADAFYGEATRVLVCAFQRLHRLPPSGEVDRDTADALNRQLPDEVGSHPLPVPVPAYTVKGHVRLADGTPLPRIKVSAFDRDLRSEQPLGEAETDAAGLYQIRYGEPQFRAAELGSADLVVKAFAADGALLASSPIVFNAPALAEVDLVVAAAARRPPSLFEKIAAAFAPLLGDIKVEELDEDDKHQDLTFLAGETGFGKATLARFIFAHRLTRPGLPPEFWFALLGGPFVSYVETLSLRRQLPMLLDTLTSIDGAAARKALDASFAQNDVPASLQGKTAGWVEAFLAQMGRHLVAGATAPTFAKLALDHAGITGAEKQQKFARLFNQYKALTPDLLAALEKDSAFTGAEVADLRTSFRLGELTRADFSVVKMLKDEFKARQPEQIRILAKQSPQQWTALIAGKAASGDIKVPVDMGDLAAKAKVSAPEVYGTSLERRFRETYPTAAFLGGLDRALNNGGAHGLRHAAELKTFLDRHDGFELMNTPIDKFLDSGGVHPELRETARSDAFRSELKAVQRVFKVAPTYAAADALLADGVHSAQMIYRMGQSTFVKRYAAKSGMSAPEARLAWNKAADTHAAVVTVVGDLKAFDGEGLPLVLKNGTDALSTFPNWNNLFQGGDMCTCEECRSVLGPAAYFADLLVFLKDRKALDPAFTVKDILFARRPDLGFIELDCDNALTPLPYVDVVCEVLEKVIAGDADDLELPGFTAMPAGSAAIQAAVLAAFAGQSIDLAATFSVTQIHPADPNRWVVHGDDVTYLLKKKATANFFAEVLPNTKADAAELRAYPAYVNPKAYDQLRQARFPFALPFDLFAEEARAAFAKCNIARWDLMRTLRGAAGPSDADVAAEYFGISVDAAAPFDEKRLILIADGTTAGQQAAWGETGHADFINTIAVVKTFLAKTGLEYDDLLALLDLRFVNPAGDITIRHLDSSCDTDKKRLENLDAAKLDRIHRFLRMWRKLGGWKMFEVDLVLRHAAIGAGSLDEPFLIRLFHFGRLRSRLGPKTTVEQLCALFGNLGTETHFTAAYKKRADGLYQSLFLNKKHIRPLDHAFDVAAVDVPAPTAEKISGHAIAVLGALGVRQADLDIFAGLTRASDGTAYITDDLTLANLSFLWRHAWLARQLKLKAADWKIVLKLMQQDIAAFADPKAAMDFVETVDRLGASGFKPDELDWLLAANRAARAAPKETDTARALSALRKALQAIAAEYDPAQYPFLNPPSSGDSLPALLTSLLQKLQRGPAGAQFFLDTLQDTASVELAVAGLPAGFDFPDPIKA